MDKLVVAEILILRRIDPVETLEPTPVEVVEVDLTITQTIKGETEVQE